uniref:Lysozyme n=1 Tax=Heliothis virescens TaxID=7102 RepID=A0A2A4J4Q5_HELVI
MIRVAWLTCALLAVAGARVYERCELARELRALGVHPDHISTWVCIAYHESRFDTAANNPHSGDHGIFQISELYWCGPGKACGLPCSALRDEDISNDLECALLVHEEHTRLQGNGFLAWVVYPQHCKHNTKKYLVDCDTTAKSSVPITRSRTYNYANSYNQPNITTERQNVESLLPPYLTVGSILRDNYGKVLEQNRNRFDWYNYKIDNIDELRLPVFNQPSQHISLPPTSAPRVTQSTITTSTPYIPRVVPWRTIETNQFRKKKVYTGTSTPGEISKKDYSTQLGNTISTANVQPSLIIAPQLSVTSPSLVNVTTTTLRPTTKTTVTTATYKPPSFTTTYRPPTSTISYKPSISTATYNTPSRSTYKTPSTTTYRPPLTTTYKPPMTSTYRPPSTTTYRPPTTTTNRPSTTTTNRPPVSTTFSTRQWFSTTTPKPNTIFKTSVTPITSKTSLSPSTITVSKSPTTAVSTSWRSSTAPDFTTPAKTTRKPLAQTSWFTFTSRTTTASPVTKQAISQSRPTQAYSLYTNSNTQKTNLPTFPSALQTQATTQKPRTTQSIFDLYLNPTKAPAIPSYKYNWGQSRLKIFGGGTTPAPVQSSTRRAEHTNGAARNQIKRQSLLSSITYS